MLSSSLCKLMGREKKYNAVTLYELQNCMMVVTLKTIHQPNNSSIQRSSEDPITKPNDISCGK